MIDPQHRRARSGARATRGLGVLALAATLAGCAGDGPPQSGSGGAFDQLQTEVFNPNCLSAGCHNAQNQAGGLNLSAGSSYDDLVDVASENVVAQANGWPRVEPFDPDSSFLLIKVTDPGTGQGTRMPQGAAALAPAQINMIREWIADGAPRGGTAVPTASPTPVPPTATPTATASVTATPASTSTASPTATGSAPPSNSPSTTPTVTPSPSPSPTPEWYLRIQTEIFDVSCNGAFCHDTATASGDLVLESAVSYGQLFEVEPENALARQEGLLRVEPNNLDASYLLTKLIGPTNPLLGARMPFGQPKLPEEQIQLVRDWIEAGAPD
ncbi:MAG: hypothetical protein ACRERC_17505 [Candidatus Binatia bacterium]